MWRENIADISTTVPEPVLFDDECDIVEEIVFENCDIFKNSSTSESVYQPAFYQSVETQTPSSPLMSINNFHKDDAGVNFYTGLESITKFFFMCITKLQISVFKISFSLCS